MKIQLNQSSKVRIELIPLIDIVFLLLVFFIYAILSMAVHRGLPVRLPSAAAAQIEKLTTLSVTITADGSTFVDKEPVPLSELAGVLKAKAAGKHQTGVLLFADRSLTYQKLFRVLDQIRSTGLNHVSLQAEWE
ncbi:MAG: biopolymer transporter ExbD [Desulfobacterales bacterium]|nr:biopolymer transporter ExbD [Desulfobacterales bacterium]